jgi:hypothetical protein
MMVEKQEHVIKSTRKRKAFAKMDLHTPLPTLDDAKKESASAAHAKIEKKAPIEIKVEKKFGPRFKGRQKIEQQAALTRFHEAVKNGPHRIIKATMKEFDVLYPWLTQNMYNGYVKAMRKKKSSTTVSSCSMHSTVASSSTTNEAPVEYKKAGRPRKGTTVKAKLTNEKKRGQMMDAITVRYKQCKDMVKNDMNRERVPRGAFNRIVAEEQQKFRLPDIAVNLPAI